MSNKKNIVCGFTMVPGESEQSFENKCERVKRAVINYVLRQIEVKPYLVNEDGKTYFRCAMSIDTEYVPEDDPNSVFYSEKQ